MAGVGGMSAERCGDRRDDAYGQPMQCVLSAGHEGHHAWQAVRAGAPWLDDVALHEELRRSSQAGLAAVIAGARLTGLVVVEPDESSGDEL